MALETIIYEKVDAVGVIKINRPTALNALNKKVLQELDAVLDVLDSDRKLRCVILTGAGEKSFVAGADIVEMSEMTGEEGREFCKKGQAVLRRLEILKIPVIAAVNGYALGGGTELAC